MVGLRARTSSVSASDAARNSSTCTTIFTVTDTTAPTVNCSPVPNASTDGNCQAAVPNVLSGVTVNDGCSAGSARSEERRAGEGGLAGWGAHTGTVKATDSAGDA